jgi:fibronectin-binding autotransporter adhesin
VQGSAAPVRVAMLGLERFENAGGAIDLRNGVAGDQLTLAGTYIGTGNASVGLDVGPKATDHLVIAGAATGSTRIFLNVDPRSASLLGAPVTLVTTGRGSANGAFTLATTQVGLIRYGLSYDAATNSYRLATGAGSAVSRLAKTGEALQSVWQQSADAWSSHMTSLRDGNPDGGGLWGQAYGKVDRRRQTIGAIASEGTPERIDVGYRQDYFGGQAGYDLGSSDEGAFGISGGYISSKVALRADAERLKIDTLNVGAYAAFRRGPIFANALAQYDHHWVDANDRTLSYSAHTSGNGYGARLELGARAGGDRLFAEPIASVSWQHVDLDPLNLLGQTVGDIGGTAVTGRVGARVGGTVDLGGGSRAVLYGRGAYVHEFERRGDALFASGGSSMRVTTDRLGDYGTGAIGVNVLTTGRVSGFIEGEVDYGTSTRGGGGRVGLRFRL